MRVGGARAPQNTREKKATYTGRNHQETEGGRGGAGVLEKRGGGLPDLGVNVATYQRWKSQYVGMKKDTLKRLKELEKENERA